MTDATTQPRVKNRRRRKLIRLDLQLKIVFITLFVASLVLLINFQLTLAGLWSISNQLTETQNVNQLLESIKMSTIRKFLFSVALAVPLAGFVGILYSFKFCGPIYKFKKYFNDLRGGRWDERCMLRDGDDLQDVAGAINEAVECFRDRVRRDHETLADVQAFLETAVFTTDGRGDQLLARIRERIAEGDANFAERFPSKAAGDSSARVEASSATVATVATVASGRGESGRCDGESSCGQGECAATSERELEAQV